MNFDNVFSIAASIVTLATVTVIVTNPNSAAVIKALGDAFSNSVRIAMGRG